MAAQHYKLDLDQQKRNVFVTQLNAREDEEDDIKAYPVVKESAGKLLENGINTLQKTLLLKKEVEVDRVDQELEEKRREFKKRMDACAEKQIDVQKKQQEMKDRVSKFERFINENEAKRKRAIQKYQNEVRFKEQKRSELETVAAYLDALKRRHNYLKEKLKRYKIYEEYLLRVIDILPANYLEVNDSMLNSLMMRHRTLSATNETLVDNIQGVVSQLDELRTQLDQMTQEHDKMKLTINSQLSQKQKIQESKKDFNQEIEHRNSMGKVELRQKRCEFGQILMAIENISEKCKRPNDPNFEDISLLEKLDIIKVYVCDQSDVARMAMREGSISPRSGSSRRKQFKNKSTNSRVGFS